VGYPLYYSSLVLVLLSFLLIFLSAKKSNGASS
jgi:hypothetical protein